MPATRTRIIDVATVAVPVTDQERALRFYTQILGFETRRDGPAGQRGRWLEVAAPGATTTVALVTDGRASGVDTGIRFTTTDADGDHAALRSQGVDTDDVLRWPGIPPMFSFRDPDGNRLVVVGQP
jgi:lactoylglutathione lyase